MPSYTLEIEALGLYMGDIPTLEIWSESFLNSSHSISSAGSFLSLTISYSGALPSSLEFRFDDLSSEAGRRIEIQSVRINDRYVNVQNFISTDSLEKEDETVVDTVLGGFLFDDSDPDSSVFTPVTLTLTSGDDVLRRYDGTDYILDGLSGRDVIYLGAGNDKVTGNAGNDILRGGAGHDLLYGEDDNDRLYGQDGDDMLYGGDGNDILYGNAGDDQLFGGNGNDRLVGHEGANTMVGGLGDDKLISGNGIDFLFGDGGADQIIAGGGNDTIDGGSGNDIIYGGAGDNLIV